MIYGLWFVVYGCWFMGYDLWFMVDDLWLMAYGLEFMNTSTDGTNEGNANSLTTTYWVIMRQRFSNEEEG